MSMYNTNTFSFSENYYLRKCLLERNQVPTQSLMKKKMSPALANIYFKSMTPKLKVLAGLEPPLKGGGENWYMPPEELLKERAVLKPLERKYMSKWNCYALDEIGVKLLENHCNETKANKKKYILEYDTEWNRKMAININQHEADCSVVAAKSNTEYVMHIYREFESLYSKSMNQLQYLLLDGAIKKIKQTREEVFERMQLRYKSLLNQQATLLYDRYAKKLNTTKEKLKNEFIGNLETHRTEFCNKLHDIKVEKHVAVEKLRHLLECQNLACQIYVALKEQIECEKEIDLKEYEQHKQIKTLTKIIADKDKTIKKEDEKEKKLMQFHTAVKDKVRYVVKALQPLVSYCLQEFPEQAKFFINMEKLILLQLNEVLQDPKVESIIECSAKNPPPVVTTRPFYVFRDRGTHTMVHSHLCPKHVTSSAPRMPVIVVNKRCIYAACDNFEQIQDKIEDYVHGEFGDDSIFRDDHDYTHALNVTYSSSQQLQELKLKSSLLQVLQQEISILNGDAIECSCCHIPHCFDCSFCHGNAGVPYQMSSKPIRAISKPAIFLSHKIHDHKIPIHKSSDHKISTRTAELKFEREPKWDSYLKYAEPRKCECSKLGKNLLQENLPAYMRNMSSFDAPPLLNYEPCSVATLKALVKKAKRKQTDNYNKTKVQLKTKDVSIQCSDFVLGKPCNCFTGKCVEQFFESIKQLTPVSSDQLDDIDSLAPSFMSKSTKSFATARALSLQQLIGCSPDVEE